MKKYLVTYKKLGPACFVRNEDYDVCLTILDSVGTIIDDHLERDSHGKLHLHVVWEYPTKPFIRRFRIQGYNVNFKEIIKPCDVARVRRYIHKRADGYAEKLLRNVLVLTD